MIFPFTGLTSIEFSGLQPLGIVIQFLYPFVPILPFSEETGAIFINSKPSFFSITIIFAKFA